MNAWETIKGWEVGQLAALVGKLGSEAKKILTCDKVSVEFTEEGAVVRGTRRKAVPKPVLGERRVVALPERTVPTNPDEYYQTRQGLCVSDDFRDEIVAVAKEVMKAPAIEIVSYDLVKDANSAKIRATLPKDHLFEDPSFFCAHLATMIERQAEGQEGDLLVKFCTNLFYVVGVKGVVLTVCVEWDSDDGAWNLYAFSPYFDFDRWGADSRAFSRT